MRTIGEITEDLLLAQLERDLAGLALLVPPMSYQEKAVWMTALIDDSAEQLAAVAGVR